ncbi:MAG TPA: hypothetical protein PK691_01670 [Thermomicrobiales bacterium]|nr:hypothetical protein [Thermomicrobiales bacterium]HRA49143.1 hypothetical protein [Thermomicrobiales bacterium]
MTGFSKPQPPVYHWECSCRQPPVVLALFDLSGRVAIQNPERYWQIDGRIVTNCPGCGKQHLLHLTLRPEVAAELPLPWRPE